MHTCPCVQVFVDCFICTVPMGSVSVWTGPELVSGRDNRARVHVLYKLFSAPSPSPDGQYVAVGSSDGSLFVWDTIGGKKKREKCKEHRCENM